jgi:hypothetical protein
VDIGVKALLMRTQCCAQCCARNALHPFGSRWFNRKFTATRFRPFNHRRNLAAGFGGHMIAKPFGQRIGVGNGRLPKAKPGANLGARRFAVLSARSSPPSAGTVTSICCARAAMSSDSRSDGPHGNRL